MICCKTVHPHTSRACMTARATPVSPCIDRGFRVTDAPLSDELQRAHDAYEYDLTTAWRRGAGKEDVVVEAPKASGNDALPVDDIETAYRLYAEEVSQAYKRPR
jgi:hypothetical protein